MATAEQKINAGAIRIAPKKALPGSIVTFAISVDREIDVEELETVFPKLQAVFDDAGLKVVESGLRWPNHK